MGISEDFAIHDEQESRPKNLVSARVIAIIIIAIASLAGLYYLSVLNYLLFHVFAEIFGIVTAIAIFAIVWSTRRLVDNSYFKMIGVALLFVAILALLHTLAYKGMGVFPTSGSNLATQLWIATRYLLSFSFLLPLLLIHRKVKSSVLFAGYSIVTALILFSIYFGLFPQAYNDITETLTPFKVASEFAISAIILLSIVILNKKRREFSEPIFKMLLIAMALAIASEMAFTLYTDVHGIANVAGHLLSIVSFYFIYAALVETSLTKPFDLLFRNQKQLQEKLEEKAKEVEEYASQMEKLANERARQLKDAERLSAIGATAGMVGHDIRNPLQAITGELYLEKLEVDSLPDGEAKRNLLESICNIDENIVYMNKIVADLQDFARPLNPKKEQVQAKKAITDALAMVSVPENIKVAVVANEQTKLTVDSTMIRRILVNLIQNGVQAMPSGGELTIKVTSKQNQITIDVQDTGDGIPKEVQDKLFTPLTTTKAKGQGFGLPVVKRMTEVMGGKITFESEAGKGTKFTLLFQK